jgi:glycosyltransferase involved in cell wall biosynthesis
VTLNLWALMLVRDEADVLEHSLAHVLTQGVSGVAVIDNASVDDTPRILEDAKRHAATLGVEVVIQRDEEPHYQSRKTSELARVALERGADWVWPVDADEIGYHDTGVPLVDAIDDEQGDVIRFDLYTYLATLLDDPEVENPFERMRYRVATPQPLAKILARAEQGLVIADGNHDAHYAGRSHESSLQAGFRVAHCPYRSVEQFIRKAVNGGSSLAATNLPLSTGQHWREYYAWWQRGGDDALRSIFETYFLVDVPSAHGLVLDPIGSLFEIDDTHGDVKAWP